MKPINSAFPVTATTTTNSYVSIPVTPNLPVAIPLGKRAIFKATNSGANSVLVTLTTFEMLSSGVWSGGTTHTAVTIAAGASEQFDTADYPTAVAVRFAIKASVNDSQGAVLFTGLVGNQNEFPAVFAPEVAVTVEGA